MTEETPQSKTTKRHTSQGTPCSPVWDSDWIAAVETREREVGHRICGARTLAGTPCSLKPNHKNGRCKYHGGFDLTAFLRISAEYRRHLKLLEVEERPSLKDDDILEHGRRAEHDVSLEPEHQGELDRTEPLADQYAAERVREAWHDVRRNRNPRWARGELNRAMRLAPHVAEPERPKLEAAIAELSAELKERQQGAFR